MYAAVMAVLNHAVDNWTDFDGWCLAKGFDPLEVPSRRLVSAAWAFLTENMDFETKDKLIYDLTSESQPIYKAVKTENPSPSDDSPQKVVIDPKAKWRAPEGWTPPGWNEEKSYQESVKFMGFNANPK